MVTRSILGLMYILRGMQESGMDVDAVLAKFGLSLGQIDPTVQIEQQLERRIHIELATMVVQPHAGLAVGQYFSLAGYGALVMLLLTCPTLRQAVDTGVAHQQLTFLFGALRTEHGIERSALVLSPPDLPEPARRFRIDAEMAGTFKLMRDLNTTFSVGRAPAEWIEVELPIPRPTDCAVLAEYQAYYGKSVSFDHDEGRFWTSRELLALPLATADSASHAMYRQQCDAMLATQHADKDDLIAKIRAYLLLQQTGVATMAATAQALGIPERTLRHQLAQRGCSFRQIRDQLRFEQAKCLLAQSSLSIEQIAERLNYAESAAFIHAFVRWSGLAPARYRRQ